VGERFAVEVTNEEDAMAEKRIENNNPRATTERTADTRNPEWNSYSPEGEGRTDEQIRADVHAVLAETQVGQPSGLEVTVLDGIVTLSGQVEDASVQQRLCEKLREVPSVKDVRDQSKAARA
jgi:osmotically-inducible protein OsmY